MRQLVQKLLPRVRGALMHFGQAPAGFLAIAAAQPGAQQMPLGPTQFPLPGKR